MKLSEVGGPQVEGETEQPKLKLSQLGRPAAEPSLLEEAGSAATGLGRAIAVPRWETGEKQPAEPSKTPRLDALWEGIKRGGRDILEGTEQLAGKMPTVLPGAAPGQQRAQEALATSTAAGEKAYQAAPAVQQHPSFAGGGRIGGNVAAGMLPGMGAARLAGMAPGGLAGAATSIPGRMAAGAASGGAQAAMLPVDPNDDYWTAKGKQVAGGLAVGGAIPGALGALGAKGTAPGTAGQLAGADVSLTPGMQIGGRGFERALEAFPILGSMIRHGEAKTIDGFNKATAAQVLEPLGIAIPKNVQAGHGLFSHVKDNLSDAYDALLPKISFSESGWTPILNHPEVLKNKSQMLSGDQARRFDSILKSAVTDRVENGILTGPAFKQAESELGGRVEAFANTNDAALGKALQDVVFRLRGELVNQNPTYGKELKNINHAYAMFTRFRDASTLPKQGGKFTPSDLLRSERRMDPSAGHGGFAAGDALMQAFAEAADKTLGKVTPPGTTIPSRSLRSLTELMALGGGGGFLHAGSGGAEMGAGAAAAAPYAAKLGMSVGGLLGRTPAGAQPAIGGAAGMGAGRAAPEVEVFPDKDRARQRLKAAGKMSEIKSERFQANRRGDIEEVERLGKRLAAAHRDYRELGGTA